MPDGVTAQFSVLSQASSRSFISIWPRFFGYCLDVSVVYLQLIPLSKKHIALRIKVENFRPLSVTRPFLGNDVRIRSA